SRADSLSGEVEETIHSILSLTRDIGQHNQQMSGEDNSGIHQLNTVLQEVSRGYEKFREDSRTASHRTGELKQAIDTTLTSLDFFRGLSNHLQDHSRQLANIAGRPELKKISVRIDAAAMSHLPGKYAAEQENNIILFDDARKSFQDDARKNSETKPLGDNVELF
ncbi:MAG: hypothetical protein ACLFPD_05795, partial [Desulfosudaceae bacterium]